MNFKTRQMRYMSALFFCLMAFMNSANAQYNNLWIPDTLSGTTFNLAIKDTFKQIVSTGNQTITGGINGNFWDQLCFSINGKRFT